MNRLKKDVDISFNIYQTGIYLLKVDNGSTRTLVLLMSLFLALNIFRIFLHQSESVLEIVKD